MTTEVTRNSFIPQPFGWKVKKAVRIETTVRAQSGGWTPDLQNNSPILPLTYKSDAIGIEVRAVQGMGKGDDTQEPPVLAQPQKKMLRPLQVDRSTKE